MPPAHRGAPRPALDFASWIVWRDDVLVVVDKPAGVLSQGADGAAGENLVDLARAHLRRDGIGVMHRIDRNVSGLVALSLDPRAARGFADALAAGLVARTYTAVVRGRPEADAFAIDAPLRKDARTNEVSVALEGAPGARAARTEVSLLRTFQAPLGRCAVVAASPITGRSHQLRVHLAHVGCPIIGDPKYGVPARGVHRPLLHARALRFPHPLGRAAVDLVREPPWDEHALTSLRR